MGDLLDLLFQAGGLALSYKQYQMAEKQFNAQKIQTLLSDALQGVGYANQENSYDEQNQQLDNNELNEASELLQNEESIPEQEIQRTYNNYSYNLNNANQYRQNVSDSSYSNAALNNLRRWNNAAKAAMHDNDTIGKFYQSYINNTLARNKLGVERIMHDVVSQNLINKNKANVQAARKLIQKGANQEAKAFGATKQPKPIRILHPYL